MQQTSATWKQLWASGAPLEARATIAGTVYADISAPVIRRAAMQNALSIGNVAAASLLLVVRGVGDIPRSATVVVEARLNDGETASEWLPQGTFYISRRARDPVTGLLALECYDALLKAQAVVTELPWTTRDGRPVTTAGGDKILFRAAPAGDMGSLAQDMALLLGLQIDPRSVIRSGAPYEITSPDAGATIRDVLSVIAQANGGNWIVTPQNMLRLVPLADVAGASEATGDAVDVEGVTGGISLSAATTVTGIRGTMEDETWLIGNDTGLVLDVSLVPVIAAEMAEGMLGRRCQAYSLEGAVCDPAAELGDFVRAGANGEIASALYEQQITLGPACRCDMGAPGGGEITDEYPYIGSAQKTLTLAKAAVAQAVGRLDDALTQQEIFNRLTDGGAAQGLVLYKGQLYINASYIQSGTLKLGGVNNVNGTLVVHDAQGNQVISLSNDGFSFKLSSNRFGLYIDGSGSIALGEKPDNLNLFDNKAFIQLMASGIAKVANLYFGTGTLGIRGMIGPMDGGGLFLCGPDGASEYIAMLSTDEARILSENTRLDGDLRVVGNLRVNGTTTLITPLAVNSGGTGGIIPSQARANIGDGCPSGSFTTNDGKTVTVTNGFITAIT